MIRIVLAEDHHVVRQGLKALLQSEPDLEIVGEAADGLAALEMVEELKPEILILDWMLPSVGGMEVTRQTRERSADTRVLILSMHADESYVLRAMREGASGYVLKDSSATDLIEAIRACFRGERYLSPPLSEQTLARYSDRVDTGQLDPYVSLTPREREVMGMVAEGSTSHQIAERLSISSRTVETHRANLMRKLGLETQADIIHYAVRRGLVSLE